MNTKNKYNNIVTDLDRQKPSAESFGLTSRHEVSPLVQTTVCGVRSLQPKPQQLSLFAITPEREDPPPYPLQIVSVPDRERVRTEWCCRLVHYESNLRLGGQFTYDEAKEILETTRYWDFTQVKDRIPRCRNQLLSLLEQVCSDCEASRRHRPSSKKQEVAA